MKIQYARLFEKRFKKLSPKLKEKVVQVIEKFSQNPHDKTLNNHPLKGKLEGKRALSVTGDMRIIFCEYDRYVVVLMLDVGTHNQIYN